MADTNITQMSLVDWLDDLTVRFLLNLPESELSSVPRLCFQVEEAQWFYEDFIRPAAAAAGNPLPSLPLRPFCLQLFQHCPLLSGFTDAQHIAAYEEFLAYKVRVPVRGAILMDDNMDKVVLVKGWKKGASWSFPRGKINKDEKDLDCAIREVYEETGYDVRQAGLVPRGEDDQVKYIDVTMREQHMRLFVFRGVAEDTYFEPQTRKEISKIQWYNIRDLPGFKKQKQTNADHMASANKFYMVAPFLGTLKKWINEQKRNDAYRYSQTAASNLHMMQAEAAEDDTDAALDHMHTALEDKSDELKRLLSIGNQAVPAVQQLPAPANGDNLLALLQGGSRPAMASVPQTPLEQMNPFPQLPATPQPQHPRQPSVGLQQPVPQFPFSPQRLQQQSRNYSVPNQAHFASNGFTGQQPPHGFPPGLHPQHWQQQQQQRQSVTMMPGVAQQTHPTAPNGMPFNAPVRQPIGPPSSTSGAFNRQASEAFGAPGPQPAISGGPAVPKAEQLPMPRLNAHSMNLLEAFKGGNKPAAGPAQSSQAPRQASQHQSALLNLFAKPSEVQSAHSSTADAPAELPTSRTPTDDTEQAPKLKKSSTINEITRTLPMKFKTKSPPAAQILDQRPPMTDAVPSEVRPQQSGPRQLYNPANPKQSVPASGEAGKPQEGASDPQIKIMQRTAAQQAPRSPLQSRSPKPKQASPARRPAAKGPENGIPTPAFTILARPGSAKPSRSPAPPSSPLRREMPKLGFQPQVLKRPESVDPTTVQKVAEVVEENGGAGDKRGRLLALFGKTAAASPPPAAALDSAAVALQSPVAKIEQAPTPEPPAAPQLIPERKPSRQNIPVRTQIPQNMLLDLFTKPSSSTHNPSSPGTPISPFTLGTPTAQRFGHSQQPNEPLPRSRLNSVTSLSGEGSGSRKGSAGTPVEAKGFLLDYLNGVVKQEGAGRG